MVLDLSIAIESSGRNGIVTLHSKNLGWRFLGCDELLILADGDSGLYEARWDGMVAGRSVHEYLSAALPMQFFTRTPAFEVIHISACGLEFGLNEEQVRSLRRLRARIGTK